MNPIEVTIEAGQKRRYLDWRELYRYRDLFRFLVVRDVKVMYQQTALGMGWAIIRPVFGVVVFSLIFGGLAAVPSDDAPYPLFAMAAVVPWNYFAAAVNASGGSLVTHSKLLSKVYFPRLLIPLTPVASGLVDFGIGLVLFMCLMAYYGSLPGLLVLLLPVPILLMMLTAAGLGMWLSALAVQYRDVKHALTFVLQLAMYAAPVVWPVSLIDQRVPEHAEALRWLYGLYPMAGVIECFRAVLLETVPVPWDLLASGFLGAGLIALTGAYYFRQLESRFADVA